MRFLLIASRVALAIALLALWAAAASASSLDGHWTGTAGATGSVSLTATTSSSPDIIVVGVAGEVSTVGGAVVTYTVTGCSLTWTLRAGSRQSGASPGPRPFFQEEWWAPASGTLSACTITATGSGTASAHVILGFAVHGATTLASPFDPAGSLPDVAINNTGVTAAVTGTVTTVNPDDFIYSISMTTNGCGIFDAAPGANGQTSIDGACQLGGAFNAGIRAVYLVVTSPQAAAAFGLSDSRTFWIHEIDAITADGGGRSRLLVMP